MKSLSVHDNRVRGFLFSPASLYPTPAAYVVDDAGTILHSWSHAAHQPRIEDDPPRYLRGWNHVEVDAHGNLFAIIPLRSVLKLTPGSELEWSCDVAAHHDIALDADGAILVLTEGMRRVVTDNGVDVVLDNFVTFVNAGGLVRAQVSLYDILQTDRSLREIIDSSIRRRRADFRRSGWPTQEVPREAVQETLAILSRGSYDGEPRRGLQRLRDLPGSPCDILHTNTLEIVESHPERIWERGNVLVCMRELNTVAVIDLNRATIRWSWGAGELSSPHQPSVLPDGQVLVFDNGLDTQRTRIIVVDPCTGAITRSWSATPPQSFFCPLAGGCERLTNGNFLVTNSTAGGAFELGIDGEIIWQLTLPVVVYGAERSRVSIYRMSAVAPDVVASLRVQAARRQPELEDLGTGVLRRRL